MSAVAVGARLLVLGLAFLVIAGPQALSLRFGWPLAGHLPIVFHRLFLRLFSVRIVERGRPAGGRPTLVLVNHVSWLDIPVIGSLRPLSFIAKSEVAAWPVVGVLARLQRTVFIDRGRRKATAEVNREVARRLVQGDAIVLFAEGTTGDGNRLLPFRSSLVGAARAALAGSGEERPAGSAEEPPEAGRVPARGTGDEVQAVPPEPGRGRIHLQPLALAYTRRNGLPVTRRERPEIAWYGDMELAPHLALFVRGGPLDVVVTWGEPIAFDEGTDRKEATALAEAAVRAALREATG